MIPEILDLAIYFLRLYYDEFLLLTFFSVILPLFANLAHLSYCEGLVSFQVGFSPNLFAARLTALRTRHSPFFLVQVLTSDPQSL